MSDALTELTELTQQLTELLAEVDERLAELHVATDRCCEACQLATEGE